MSTETVQQTSIEMPDGVNASMEGRRLSIKGKLGEAKKDYTARMVSEGKRELGKRDQG